MLVSILFTRLGALCLNLCVYRHFVQIAIALFYRLFDALSGPLLQVPFALQHVHEDLFYFILSLYPLSHEVQV